LLLLGHNDFNGSDIDEFGEPWPVIIPGLDRPIRSDRVASYFDSSFWYYQDFYMKTKHCSNGNYDPQRPWTEWPEWIPQLITEFDSATEQIRRFNIEKANHL